MNEEEDIPRVRQAYARLPRVEPPPALDAAILASARAAITPRVANRRPRWLVPVSAAASAILAIGVGWRLGQDDATQPWRNPVTMPSGQPVAPATEARQGSLSKVTGESAATATTPAAQEKPQDMGKDHAPTAPEPFPAQAPQPAAAPAPARENLRAADEGRVMPKRADSAPAAVEIAPGLSPATPETADEPVPPAPPMKSQREDNEDVQSRVSATTAAPAAPAAPAKNRPESPMAPPGSTAEGGRQLPALPIRGEPPPGSSADGEYNRKSEREAGKDAAKAAEDRRDQWRERDDAANASKPERTTAAEPHAPVVQSPVPASASAAGKLSAKRTNAGTANALLDAEDRLDPERWLQAIRRLQAQGEIDAARGEVARFQERFPRYAVPEDLAPFLAPGK